MSTQTELDKTKKELSQTQEKLSSTMTAINNEKLILESVKKDIKDTQKEKKSVDESIENSKKELENLNLLIENKKKENEDIISSMQIAHSALFDSNNQLIIGQVSKHDALKLETSKLEDQIQILEDSKKEKETSFNLMILNKTKELSKLETSIEDKNVEKINLIAEINSVNNQINSLKLQDKLDLLNDVLIKIDDHNTKLNIIKNDITEKKEDIKKLTNNQTKLKESIKGFNEDNIKLQNDYDSKKKERDDFAKAKLELQQTKELFLQREEFIKEKYQEAGLRY